MKYVVLLCSCLLCSNLLAQTQMQSGCVKTRGRMVDGKHVPGLGLSGTVVSVKDRNDIAVKSKDGYFSFPIKGAQYVVQSVTKKDYALVDADAAPKTYLHTADTVYFLMETPDRITQDKLESERRIRRTLQRQLQEREDEIETLKTENKISQQEYQKALQKLYADQENNEKLISEMVERYSKLDYDQMNNFYRQVNNYIENGELTRADSLLKTRGDVQSQVEAELKKGETIAQKEKELQQAKAVHKHDIEELAQRCYSYFESFKMQHMNDSAAKYIELRAKLDTTNVEWMNDAGGFITNFQAKYDRALRYYEAGLRQSIKQYGETSEWTAAFFNNIGLVYNSQGEYTKALENHDKALEISVKVLGKEHPDVATSYNNIGYVYDNQGEYPKALENHDKALEIREKVFGTEHPDVATSYNNIGLVYNSPGEYTKALEYHNKALEINVKIFGTEHPDVATSYNNIGFVYNYQGEYTKALEYHNKALEIWEKVFGTEHPDVATSYNNIGSVYDNQGEYSKALEHYNKALEIQVKVFGTEHPDVATSYNNIGSVYNYQGEYTKALECYNKALEIWEKVFGAEHPGVAASYNNIGYVYDNQGEYTKALEYHNKALEIKVKIFGTEHPGVAASYNNIGSVYNYQGEYAKALEYYNKALEIWVRVFGAEHSYTKGVQENIDMTNKAIIAADQTKMQEYAFIATTVVGDSPAKQKGLDGEYFMLEFADWNINSQESLFEINNSMRGKPKAIVVMKGKEISTYHFENTIGVQFDLKQIGKDEKNRIIKAYKEWKKKRGQ